MSVQSAIFAPRAGAATLRAMNTTRLSLLTIAAALALAGCGNKGPLVLPDTPGEEAPVAVDETDAAANEAADGSAADEAATEAGAAGDATMDDAGPALEPVDDTDAPAEPEPLPREDGNGG